MNGWVKRWRDEERERESLCIYCVGYMPEFGRLVVYVYVYVLINDFVKGPFSSPFLEDSLSVRNNSRLFPPIIVILCCCCCCCFMV